MYVILYGSGTATLKVNGKDVVLRQETNYPWEGDITMTIDKNKAGDFGLRIRIPGWVQGKPVPSDLYSYADGKKTGLTIKVNGGSLDPELDHGYFYIKR